MSYPIQKVQGASYYRIPADEIEAGLKSVLTPGTVEELTFHWTAGAYNHAYRAYQILIDDDYILVATDILNWYGHQHTWRRNYRNIGISFMAMANGYPLTRIMVERGALVAAILKKYYSIRWDWILDHAFWAKLDGYPGLRWDIRLKLAWENQQTAYHAILRKARWYYNKLEEKIG